MLSNITGSKRKVRALASTGVVALALLISGFPSPTFGAGDEKSTPVQERPDAACPPDGQCFADVPSSNPFYTFLNRIYQQDIVSGYSCGGPGEPCDAYNRPYYRPGNNVTRSQMTKFIDNARRLPEIHIAVTGGTAPIYARNDTGGAIGAYSTSGQALTAISESQLAIYAQTGDSTAVYGVATGASGVGVYGSGASKGVYGVSTNNRGVRGESTNADGVSGFSTNGTGVSGSSTATNGGRGVQGSSSSATNGFGVYGNSSCANCHGVDGESSNGIGVSGFSNTGQAGHFTGNVQVTGNLSKGGGSFKIDDPLDPENKYLYHSFVESPDMMNIYNGNVTTDAGGEAVVTLPPYFELLNRDFRYQLTPIGQFAQAMVAQEVNDNKFVIKTDKPNVKISWQVTGIRQDPYANAHRIPVEEDKPANEQGKYLHPTEWGQPASSGIDYAARRQMQQASNP
jgi:hypothetical protein